MRSNIIYSLVVLAIGMTAFTSRSKPAMRGVRTITMADGYELRVQVRGNGLFHQYFTEDNYPIFEQEGIFYYCDIDSDGNIRESDIIVKNKEDRDEIALRYLSSMDMTSIKERLAIRASSSPRIRRSSRPARIAPAPPFEKGYGLIPDVHFPAYGTQKALVILVEYSDVKFNAKYNAKSYFTRMLKEDGFCDEKYGGTGCAEQYFRENSMGAFTPEFDIYGPVTLSQPQKYYGENDRWGDDLRAAEMVMEACNQLDDIIDFREYDRDGDGIIDNVFVFYAGPGESSYGGTDTVWPHSWDVESAGLGDLIYDGVKLYSYGCTNEWEGNRPDGVGTFIHEFSHVIGLPDLYSTSYYSDAFTPDEWSVLDYGPYNNVGRTPPNYSAFERYAMGWIKPKELDGPVNGARLATIDENECYIIRTEKDTEYFLLENRQKKGWDKYIPGHGMLIWHIDYDESAWERNVVNNIASHQYVDLIEADNDEDFYDRTGDSFPGQNNITSFTSETMPALKSWSGADIDRPITNIRETDGIITFDVGGAKNNGIDNPTDFNEAHDILINGLTVYTSSLAEIAAFDLRGTSIAEGRGEITLPAPGIYIINLPSCGKSLKIKVTQ